MSLLDFYEENTDMFWLGKNVIYYFMHIQNSLERYSSKYYYLTKNNLSTNGFNGTTKTTKRTMQGINLSTKLLPEKPLQKDHLSNNIYASLSLLD